VRISRHATPYAWACAAGFLACYFPLLPFRTPVSHQIQRYLLPSLPAKRAIQQCASWRTDYYGHSVTVGLAPLRPSRIPLCAGRIERDLGVPSVPLNRLVACRPPVGRFKTTKLGIVRYQWLRHQVSCRRVCRLHRWRLGFRQCGFHRITRDLHGSAFDTFAAFRAFPPCCFPLPLSRSGWVGVPEVTSSRTSAPWGGDPAPG